MTRNFDNGLNLNGERNINNTPRALYNCGGYAFETFSWLYPGLDERNQMNIDVAMRNYDYEEAIKMSVKDLLEQFPEYKTIPTSEIAQYPAKDYAIVAFRIAFFDFHFWKLGRNGCWYEKRGSTSTIHCHSFDQVWEPWVREDGYCYDSEITFFVKKR